MCWKVCPITTCAKCVKSPQIYFSVLYFSQTRNTTAIMRVGLASLGIMGGLIDWSPLKPPDHHSTIVLSGSKVAFKWAPIMPWDTSLSDSGCNFFQSGISCNCSSDFNAELKFLFLVNFCFCGFLFPVDLDGTRLCDGTIFHLFYV